MVVCVGSITYRSKYVRKAERRRRAEKRKRHVQWALIQRHVVNVGERVLEADVILLQVSFDQFGYVAGMQEHFFVQSPIVPIKVRYGSLPVRVGFETEFSDEPFQIVVQALNAEDDVDGPLPQIEEPHLRVRVPPDGGHVPTVRFAVPRSRDERWNECKRMICTTHML